MANLLACLTLTKVAVITGVLAILYGVVMAWYTIRHVPPVE